MMPTRTATLVLVLVLAAACAATPARTGVKQALPPELHADYDLFAVRCSKCHALSRPLQSSVTDDRHWANYIERMRLQPASGISAQDAPRILRFLSYYTRHRSQFEDAPGPR